MTVSAASANQELLLLRSELARRQRVALPENHVPVALRLRGELNAAAARRTLGELVQRHSALRTQFTKALGAHLPELRNCLLNVFRSTSAVIPGMYVQRISPQVELPLEQKWIGTGPASVGDDEIERAVAFESEAALDPDRAPIARAVVLSAGATDHVLVLVLSHLISDLWSLQLFQEEFAALYSAYRSGLSVQWEPVLQHSEFVQWEHRQIRSGAFDDQLRFWEAQWQGNVDSLIGHKELPFATFSPDGGLPERRTRTCRTALTQEESAAIRRLATALRVTPYTVMRTALLLWLHFATGRLEIGSSL